jgi:pimeloyl-ACP methyl ester carboxylesterase
MNEPAFVFGSSIGALIGLDLIARNPEQVRILIAHDPPAWELLPVAERDPSDAISTGDTRRNLLHRGLQCLVGGANLCVRNVYAKCTTPRSATIAVQQTISIRVSNIHQVKH